MFDKDYKFEDLDTLEKQIKKDKHLPEVPSVEEMTENGMDITQMNLVLLKKVEELTLHVIDQNKRLEIAEKKIAMLEKNNK